MIVKENTILSYGWNGMPASWENTCEDREYMSSDAGAWLDPNEIEKRWPFQEEELDPNLGYARRFALKTKPEVLHSEMNALMKVAQSTESSTGATMFCTHAPCIECAKLVYQAGITTVYYKETYRDDSGLRFLRQGGINVHQYTDRT